MPRMCMLTSSPRLDRKQADHPPQANLQGEISSEQRIKRVELRNIRECEQARMPEQCDRGADENDQHANDRKQEVKAPQRHQ